MAKKSSVKKSAKMVIKKPTKVKAKKVAAAKPRKKCISVDKPYTKKEMIQMFAELNAISKKQAKDFFESFSDIVKAHLAKKGPGVFTFPGIAKFKVVKKPATKARKGTNPFTGELMTFAAKKACNVVKIKPLKTLQEAIK